MQRKYRIALAEVKSILDNSEEHIKQKIPKGFITFVENNMMKDHSFEIDSHKNIMEQNISNDAKSIIALIYRDYICSSENKEELIKQEMIKREQEEIINRERYGIIWQ